MPQPVLYTVPVSDSVLMMFAVLRWVGVMFGLRNYAVEDVAVCVNPMCKY